MLHLYETFVQIVEHETLVQAASSMHLTQPTVTRHVQQLEQMLGMPLFDRMGKRLSLNRAGELVYGYAKRYIALTEKMKDELNGFTDPERGSVYIGAGLTPSIYLLPPILARYREEHAGVQFHVTTGSSKNILHALHQREVDVGIVTTFSDYQGELYGHPLFEDDLLLVAQPGHPLTQAPSVNIEQVVSYPFVLMRQGSGLRQLMGDLASSFDVQLTVAMETDSLESISRLVQHGVGLSCLPRSSAVDDIRAGRLAVLKLADASLGARTITMVTRSASVLPACTAHFCAALTAEFR